MNKGVVAAGHTETARVAQAVLREGGNAFDAVIAAHFVACVAEPVLASLGGGGYLLAKTAAGEFGVYDFFTQTPRRKRPLSELDFSPIAADFGTTTQEFHIGLGSVATPGTVRGLFAIHDRLATMSMRELLAPAVELAQQGVLINRFQAYINQVIQPILRASPELFALYESRGKPTQLLGDGERMVQPELANLLEGLAYEGERLFYEGEVAQAIDQLCKDAGGSIGRDDLCNYTTQLRKPLQVAYREAVLFSNPPPSAGGSLIGFGLQLLHGLGASAYGQDSVERLALLVEVMALTQKARLECELTTKGARSMAALLQGDMLSQYQAEVCQRAQALRGTTHMSVMDAQGNMASLSTSNGEGCGYLVPGLGFMLNNMLGEQDINTQGFHQWVPDQRMTSMMSPSLLRLAEDHWVALGSGGSNRIRTAILQVIVQLVEQGADVYAAVHAPRIHCEQDQVQVESGFSEPQMRWLSQEFPAHHLWPQSNLYFGGVHAVMVKGQKFSGAGDPRRGGVSYIAD